jgi:hypothetical protein
MAPHNPDIIGEAMRLAASGRPVFPCKRTKAPYTRNGFKDATTNQAAIAKWWARWPDALIGLPTGSGIIVIDTDLDEESGKNGEFELINMPDLPPTYMVRTPRGGFHRYYRTPDGMVLPNSSDKLAKGIDIRGDGGYVVAPPSSTDRGSYQVVEDMEMATLPDSWVELILPKEEASQPELTSKTPSVASYAQEITPWDDFKDKVTWFEILTPHGWARGKSSGDNVHWTRPGKDDGSTSATTKGEDGPLYVFSTSTEFSAGEAYSKHYVYAALNHRGDMREAARALAAKGYGTGTRDVLDVSRHKGPAPEAPVVVETIEDYWTIETLRSYTVDPSHYLVGDGWMRRSAVTLLVGMTGIGKSVLATQMAAQIAVGADILGKLKVAAPLRVVVVQAENDPDTMKRDLCAVTDALNLDEQLLDENLRMYHKPGLTPSMVAAMMVEIHKDYPYDVIVIDNYMAYCGGDINSTETFFAFRGAIEPSLHGLKAGCLLLTHPPKPVRGEAAPRHAREVVYNAAGTSALANWVRTSCELALAGQEDNRCILRFSKNAERTGLRDPATGQIVRKIYLERSDYAKPYWRISENQDEAATGQYDEALEQVWTDDPMLSVREAAMKVGCSKSTAERLHKRIKERLSRPSYTPYGDQ